MKHINKKTLREFGYLISFGFPFFVGFLIPFLTGHNIQIWTLFISIPTLFIAIIYPNGLKIFYKSWMFLGFILGWINSRIILGLIFFIVLCPTAFFLKLFGFDPLRKRNFNQPTYRQIIKTNKTDLRKIF